MRQINDNFENTTEIKSVYQNEIISQSHPENLKREAFNQQQNSKIYPKNESTKIKKNVPLNMPKYDQPSLIRDREEVKYENIQGKKEIANIRQKNMVQNNQQNFANLDKDAKRNYVFQDAKNFEKIMNCKSIEKVNSLIFCESYHEFCSECLANYYNLIYDDLKDILVDLYICPICKNTQKVESSHDTLREVFGPEKFDSLMNQ
jgi:hypothetical protein